MTFVVVIVIDLVIIAWMSVLSELGERTRYILILVLGGVVLVVLCLICVLGGLYVTENIMPAGAQTRTALVQLFSTVTPDISSTPKPSTTQEYPSITIPTPNLITPTTTSSPSPSPSPTFSPPVWLDPPAGNIVYTCYINEIDQICLMMADSSNQNLITETQGTNFFPSLSPDGKKIIFSSKRDGNFEIFEMDTAGGNIAKKTDNIGNLYAPEISPNGNRIIFALESGGDQTIWIMKRDGSNARPVLSSGVNGINPTWAPDNNRIAFTSTQNGSSHLFITNILGSKIRQVTKGISGISGRSSWSPDGNWLAFSAGPDGNRDIYIIGVDGKNLQRLTDGGDNLGPCFSPDGKWITFNSSRDGKNEIYVMRVNGSQETRLTGAVSSNWQPRWGQ